ncbi:MAG: metal-dependent hydrolase [Pseudomonadota bacterium]
MSASRPLPQRRDSRRSVRCSKCAASARAASRKPRAESLDSLTQAALGAAVGHLVAGRELGPRAALMGAVCGTLPDLDVLVRYADPVTAMTVHRSWSHSWFWLTLASPVVWLLLRPLPGFRGGGWPMLLAIWLAFVTHPLLDCMTIYGTQALQPFSDYPISVGSVFIIDPVFSVPLAVALVLALRRPARRRHVLSIALAFCASYLALSSGLQARLERSAALAAPAGASSVKATPTPFNTLRWRLLRLSSDGHCDQFVYAWQRPQPARWRCYPQQREFEDGLGNHAPYQRMRWFTHGWYALRRDGDALVLTDLRMGSEGFYIFRFVLGEVGDDGVRPVPARQLTPPRPELRAFARAYRHAR